MIYVLNPYKNKNIFISPERVVENLKIQPGDTVYYFGSGGGAWPMALSKKVGQKGRVIVLSDNEFRISAITAKAALMSVSNIKALKVGKLDGTIPVREKAEFILVSNMLSEIKHKDDVLVNLSQNLTKGSQILIVEWKPLADWGPSKEKRLVEDEVVLLAARAGFVFKYLIDAGSYHYGLIFEYTGEKFNGKRKTRS